MTTTTPGHDQPDVGSLLAKFFPEGRPEAHVGGRWAASERRTDSLDPSTGQPIETVPNSTPVEVTAAVEEAARAQASWARTSLPERVECLRTFSNELASMGEDLALLESVDSGNPLRATSRDMALAQRYLTEWPAYALTQAGRATQPFHDGLSYTLRRPYGVVGRIVAYNHPSLFTIAGMIFPLLAGNTVVAKSAQQTPVATLALGALAERSLPPGVLNLVSGGAEAGDALVTSPHIKRISFVGSGRTARTIQSRLSHSGLVKHFTAELGGKNAMIVCADVDLAAAADAAVAGMSLRISQGQSCQSTSRVLVHRDVHDKFVDLMAQQLSAMTLGPAYDARFDMGPLVSATHRDHVESFLGHHLPPGARIQTGGGRPADCPPGGFFLEPTLVTGAPDGSRIATEEIFGPVVVVQPWDSEEQAIALANGSELGLSAAVWSRDIDRALRIAHAMEAGYVWVNDANRHYAGAPFGGVKGSGVGREESVEDLLSYSELTAINVRISPHRPEAGS